MSRSRSTRALIAVAVSSALLLAGCSAGQTGGGGATEPQTGGTLNYLEHQPHTSLYPPSGGFYPNGGIVNNITDRLVYQNPETLEFEPWIATDWESNDDATEYTFNLRSDVTFSDGTPLDADVVAKNFDLYGLGDPDRALPVSEAINNYERSEVVDADTVKFFFTAPAPGFLQATSTINSGLVSDATLDLSFEGFGPGNSQNIIGSGPFTISGEEIGTRVDLAAREDYAWAPPSWENQGRPYLDGITITVTPEDSVRVGALVSGQADIVRNVEAQDEAQVEVPGYSILAAQTKGVNNGLSLRIGNEKLSDIRVRQAITAGIDRQAVIDTIYSANYPLATSVLSSSAPGYVNTEEYFAYDQAKAKSLLDEAGWVPGADGIRAKDGQKLTLVVNEAAPQPRSFEALTLISQQLAEIGVDLQILKADAGTYAEAILDADQVQIYHSMVGRTDLDVIKSQFYSSNRNVLLNKNNKTGEIVDPKLEELLLAVASTPAPDARIAASQAVQTYLAEQAYQIPLFEEPQVYGQADYVHGFQTESIARPIFSQVWLDR
ncbi:TIGR04028 family ABC transporter substrate-binding protein [Pseudoclavibacter chungangensis]|uniref:TIGR04028 family ABC transporter substrate-binding protein n=1 Tax=Pseudoclavibacter chungangensis TaxID=587635 RepID=A0A7J5BRQ0_9MICO|nr:TIGR04028 family ABC transporter substrate-binding protein [Pseudoclavibacter chungangensis]KAB1654832.1 TIGR04028 family ABC transporter substrate-binding protein [Pseudoclavibacter chungangensis]NYJ68045.1 peptide/nickel transport system substrate-binding protein [Pseudoclavibacter chungangensis]